MRVVTVTRSVIPISRTAQLENLAKCEGWHSTIINPDGSKYTGNWHDNKKEGIGDYIVRKRRFICNFKNNLPNRYGVSGFDKGNKTYELEYRGEWKDGLFDGQGIRYYRDKSIFKGTLVRSKREGFGQMWYSNGSYYEGDWYNNLRSGDGLFVEVNGNRYEGRWIKDKKHGPARYFLTSTGQYMDGVWNQDVCVTSIMADIPFRQTSQKPTEFTINEVQLVDEANKVTDFIETALLNLPQSFISVSTSPKKPKPVTRALCVLN